MAMERVMRGADASLVVMHILTSKKMPKRVYIDDVIDRVALFLRFQVRTYKHQALDLCKVSREIGGCANHEKVVFLPASLVGF